jgi:DNA invertase Pin-like site-specific DNA recombinase
VRVEFVKETLVFTGEDSPMANLMLSVMGAFAEFERSLIRERQREGIALAKQRGAYKGRKKTFTPERAAELVQRAGNSARKPSWPVTSASAGKPSTSTCATPDWSETLPHRSIRRATDVARLV